MRVPQSCGPQTCGIGFFNFIDYRYASSYSLSPFKLTLQPLASCLYDSMSDASGNANARTVKLVLPSSMTATDGRTLSNAGIGGYLVGALAQDGCNADNTRCCKALSGAARYWCTSALAVMVFLSPQPSDIILV